ncbi:MAG: hypothetical protein Q8935_17700 [Bacillota bacterium]|nr:hypothetical protein [Bacillota bacterium]MDP4154418.1 hypothetical protein [Bacillota bacterium]
MQKLEITEKNLEIAVFQFIFPFSLKNGIEQNMFPFLKQNDFKPFRLDHIEDEHAFYGDFHVSHRNLEAYFLSFTNRILFPHSEDQKGFQRFSKRLNLEGCLKNDYVSVPFKVNSIDVTLCPFELGLLTIRTELTELLMSHALEFGSLFRVLEPITSREEKVKIECGGKIFTSIESFVFDYLFDGLTNFFERKTKKEAYFESFPFFEDERMYVQSLLSVKSDETFDKVDVYRAGSLSGLDANGELYVSANNLEYIQDYLDHHSYNRWAPRTHFVIDEHIFTCITNENVPILTELANNIYGKFYYGLLLNLFHKVVLLKLAHAHAVMDTDRDIKEMEKLIFSINSFTANFFSLELVTESRSQEIFFQIRKTFNIEQLYKNAKEALYSLYKYQENVTAKKNSLLLLILTLYSVIGQMFGMSIVTGDFAGSIRWGNIMNYNMIELFALFVASSGIIISLVLGVKRFYDWISFIKNRKTWIEETILSSVKKKN